VPQIQTTRTVRFALLCLRIYLLVLLTLILLKFLGGLGSGQKQPAPAAEKPASGTTLRWTPQASPAPFG
jgi:hypothetical protein